jgi:hypothetical protein
MRFFWRLPGMPLSSCRAGAAGAILALALSVFPIATGWAQTPPVDPGPRAADQALPAEPDTTLTKRPTSDEALQKALADVLGSLAALRQRNQLAVIDCTKDFSPFFRHPTAAPYVAFFRSVGFEEITARVNQKNVVYWELYTRQLAALGFDGFVAGDRIVISLVVDSTAAQTVTTFKATLLNSNQL